MLHIQIKTPDKVLNQSISESRAHSVIKNCYKAMIDSDPMFLDNTAQSLTERFLANVKAGQTGKLKYFKNTLTMRSVSKYWFVCSRWDSIPNGATPFATEQEAQALADKMSAESVEVKAGNSPYFVSAYADNASV